MMGDQIDKLCDYTNVQNSQFISQHITSPDITVDFFEVNSDLLNLICKDQFGGYAMEDVDTCKICLETLAFVICYSLIFA
jgi:hypothetical protein